MSVENVKLKMCQSMTTEHCADIFAWLLRTLVYSEGEKKQSLSNLETNHKITKSLGELIIEYADKKIILIEDVIKEFKCRKKQDFYDDAHYIRYEQPRRYNSCHHKRLQKIYNEVYQTFNHRCDVCTQVYCCNCNFKALFEKFFDNFMTVVVINETVVKYPTRFIIEGYHIRAIRS